MIILTKQSNRQLGTCTILITHQWMTQNVIIANMEVKQLINMIVTNVLKLEPRMFRTNHLINNLWKLISVQ